MTISLYQQAVFRYPPLSTHHCHSKYGDGRSMATIIYCLSYRKATRIVLSTSLVFIILMVPAEISTLSRMDTDQIANNVFMLMQLANHNIKLLV